MHDVVACAAGDQGEILADPLRELGALDLGDAISGVFSVLSIAGSFGCF